MTPLMRLRPIAADDHPDVLELNERNVQLLAPMDATRLVELVALADTASVIDVVGRFAGFVLTFTSGSAYDGENFAWFGERHDDFCYLDRVVLHEDFRRLGLGTQVYEELEKACGRRLFALEVNIDPPNEPSLTFHRARGFEEVGRRLSGGHEVALFLKTLPSA